MLWKEHILKSFSTVRRLMFFGRKIENGFLKDEIDFKKPHFRPAILLAINNEGLLPLVQGVVEVGGENEKFIVFD